MRKFAWITLACLLLSCCALCISCQGNGHNYSKEWSYNADYHWHACTDKDCTSTSDDGLHSFEIVGSVQKCSECGYSIDTNTTYSVKVLSMGGTTLPGVGVTLLDGETEVGSAITGMSSMVNFPDLEQKSYKVTIDQSTLPAGYYLPDDMAEVVLTVDQKSAVINIPSAVISDEQMPNGHSYALGSVMYDFATTAITADGTRNISLSAYLSVYKVAILNFWYSGCEPCKSEFPHMDEAYLDYNGKVALIALNNGYDTARQVENFVATNGYHFDFVNDERMFDLYSNFGADAFPTTVVVDRYGVVASISDGSLPSVSAWKALFEYYISDDYVPNYGTSYKPGNDDVTTELTKPNIDMPSNEAINDAVTGDTDRIITYSAYDDEYSWPWIVDEKDGRACVKTTNQNRAASYSILVIEVEMTAGEQLLFDYFSSTQLNGDLLYVQVDEVLQYTLSGEDSEWNNDVLLYTARNNGKYQITLTYQKDYSANVADDTFYVTNFRVKSGVEITKHTDLLYNAANNYTLDENVNLDDYGVGKGYINYVETYLGEDGLYRVALSGNKEVKSENDPLLLADLYYMTPWNDMSVWNLAYYGSGLFNPSNPTYIEGYFDAVEDYTWLQNQSSSRYVPINEELKTILETVVNDIGRKNDANQWLEVCRYYVNYGACGANDTCFARDNTVSSFNWRMAEDYGTIGSANTYGNEKVVHVAYLTGYLPRGSYYKITTTDAGAYKIYSTVAPGSDYDLQALNPIGFFADENGNILEENDDYVTSVQGYDENNNPLYDNNFYIYIYLEANTEYYIGGCFFAQDQFGEFDVKIEYLGEDYSYFTSCAYDPAYTYDPEDPTFTPFILPKMGKDMFILNDSDGIYYAQEFDGSQGSMLYIKLIGQTYYNGYSNFTLEQLIESDRLGSNLEQKIRLTEWLIEARANTNELYGCVPAYEELVSILNAYMNRDDDTNYSGTSWLLSAYYYRNVDQNSLDALKARLAQKLAEEANPVE